MLRPFSTTVLALGLLGCAAGQEPAVEPVSKPILLGEGRHQYRWVQGWGVLPEGDLGNTHGAIVVDRKGRILANTDTERAVVMFSADGQYLGSWGKELGPGVHGMTLRVEDDVEYVYLAHTNGHQVVKATTDGEILWKLGPPSESGLYDDPGQFRPTAVTVAPDGRIFVADGYGKSYVHLYGPDRKYRKSFGGPGEEPGRMRTPHGLWMDTRGGEPLLLVCDRENHRLQWFDLEGNFVRMVAKDLRRPCNAFQRGLDLVVADLAGRVTILDKEDEVVLHLGDNPDPKLRAQNGVAKDKWRAGEFLAPHCACWDGEGNLYVLDWNRWGRLTKLERVR